MKIHLISGFLGSGKTTAIQEACRQLIERGINTGVITNDQGIRLVDGDLFKSLGIPGRQVINGCFCCNYKDLETNIQSLKTSGTEVFFAESVGSCTDIVATVLKPLLHFYLGTQVTISVFADARLLKMILQGANKAFDQTVNYIYFKQLEEAGIIIINKIDLLSEIQLSQIKGIMQEKYAGKILLYQNSFDKDHIGLWLNTLNDYDSAGSLQSLAIDYEIYAAGEARLAWFDGELEIYSANNTAIHEAGDLINNFYKKVNDHHYPIGHLKFLINSCTKISFTGSGQPPAAIQIHQAGVVKVLINMRVQTEPARLRQLVADVVNDLEILSGSKIVTNNLSAFQPGYPRPTHRFS